MLRSVTLVLAVVAFCPLSQSIPRFFLGKYNGISRRDYVIQNLYSQDFTAADGEPKDEYDEKVCNHDKSQKVLIDYFEQPLDHFDSKNTAKWEQHYQVQEKYYKEVEGVQNVFLMIGGEGPIHNNFVCFDNYTHMELAKKHNALVVQLEHRYFGGNKGIKDLSVANLKYLTTKQALADLAKFVEGFNKRRNYTNPKWVAVGGSYPGTIAAMLRVKYPNITQGNVASSAPYFPKVDYWEYAAVMEKAYNETSKECVEEIQKAFEELNTKITDPSGRDAINKAFRLKDKKAINDHTPLKDLRMVQASIFDAFQGIVQYTYDGAGEIIRRGACDGEKPHITVECACTRMTANKPNRLEKLFDVFQLANGKGGSKVEKDKLAEIESNYDESIEPLKSTELSTDKDRQGIQSTRAWLWFTCNEYGWFQSTTGSKVFGNAVNIDFYYQLCADIFEDHFNAELIDRRIRTTLIEYGYPWNYTATNVFLSNGGYDPWSALGIYVKNNDTEKNHVIVRVTDGAAHCSDLYAAYKGEPKGLQETRELFNKEVDYYFSLPSSWSGASASFISLIALIFTIIEMRHLSVLLLVAIALCPTVESIISTYRRNYFSTHYDWSFQNPAEKYDETVCTHDSNQKVQIDFFEQPLDHFDPKNSNKWEQHYQVQEKYYKEVDGAQHIVLMIGGEGAMTNKWVCFDNYTHMEAAKKHSALVVQLEHRHFGRNKGIKDLSVENLKYLTTNQALADLAKFVEGFNKRRNFTNPKWIAVGGSYPGTMAALLRVKYSNITQGNIASSAPYHPKVDFWEYAAIMEKTFNDTKAGCLDEIQKAFAELNRKILLPGIGGKRDINSAFRLEDKVALKEDSPLDDIRTVQFSIFDAFQGVVQYTFDANPSTQRGECGGKDPHVNVECACERMLSKKTNRLEKLFDVFLLANKKGGDDVPTSKYPKVESIYKEALKPWLEEEINFEDPAKESANSMRGWWWLSCNEYGWLQSTTGSKVFGSAVPIDFYYQWCADLFKGHFNAEKVDERIRSNLNENGYPWNYTGTNVFLSNGAYDPWSALGIYVKNNDTEKNHVIVRVTEGAAHCSDLYAAYDKEPKGLQETRELLNKEIDYYFSLPSTWSGTNSVFLSTFLLLFVAVFNLL